MTLIWYHWAILGIILVGLELLIPACVLVWFGLGALFVALVLAFIPTLDLTPQLLIWIADSLSLVVLWFKIFKPHRHKILIGSSSAQTLGEKGLLVSDVAPYQRAQVRFQKPLMGSDVWECIADEPIKAGTRVKVSGIEGNILKITTAEEHTQ